MNSNSELHALCDLAKRSGAQLTITHDERALKEEGRMIIDTVQIVSGVPGIGPYPMSAIFATEALRKAKHEGKLGPVIVSAYITDMPNSHNSPMPEVIAKMSDGQEHKLFWFYPDEISFEPYEFVGLTVEEGRQLRLKKDLQYLQSDIPPVRRVGDAPSAGN